MENNMIKIATSERLKGTTWDYEGKSEIVKIFISYDHQGIHFLQFLYHENGNNHLTRRPDGSSAGNKFKTVKLNYSDEFLTVISGTHSSKKGGKITSLMFTTNKNNYGPYGNTRTGDPEFSFDLGKDKTFGGFHGSNHKGGMLESFGVYVRTNEPNIDRYEK
ncbi:hypothetical protein NMG60_11032972 [Bertholletia excelsa]